MELIEKLKKAKKIERLTQLVEDDAEKRFTRIPLVRCTMKVLQCWDGASRDQHTTDASSKRASQMLLLQHNENAFNDQGNCVNDELRSQYQLLSTVFCLGFKSEVSAIAHAYCFTRPNAFQSGNGAALEIHAADSACACLLKRWLTMLLITAAFV